MLRGSLFAQSLRTDCASKGVVSSRTGNARQQTVAARAGRKATKTSKPKTSKGSAGDTASVTISLQKEAAFGFQYALVGGDPALGDWDPAQAAILEWSEGHVWSTTLTLPSDRSIEYKFILVNNNMEAVDWQPGENRTIATSSNVGTIQGQWDEELGAGESEDASTDMTSSGDASDDSMTDGNENGAVTEPEPSRGSSWWQSRFANVTSDVAGQNGGSSSEGSLAEADVAPAASPAIEKAADVAADVSNNTPAETSSKPSASPPKSAPVSKTGGGGNTLAVAGASALVAVALGAAVVFSYHDSRTLVQQGDVKGAVSGAVKRLNPEGLAGSVGEQSSKILSSVSETSGKHLDALGGHLEGLSKTANGHLEGLSKTAGGHLEGLTKTANGHLEGLSKAANEGFGGISKAASEGLGGLSKATGDGVGAGKSRR